MGLRISRLDDGLYQATYSPPRVRAEWTSHRLPIEDLIKDLQDRSFHQQDIGDALYELDPSLLRLP
jgi:hypothetical protein